MCPVSPESTSVSDFDNSNGHGGPFVVGCGALTTLEYVVTPDLENFIDKWQAPVEESDTHAANTSFQNRHTRKRKSEDVHKSDDGQPGKRRRRRKQRKLQKR